MSGWGALIYYVGPEQQHTRANDAVHLYCAQERRRHAIVSINSFFCIFHVNFKRIVVVVVVVVADVDMLLLRVCMRVCYVWGFSSIRYTCTWLITHSHITLRMHSHRGSRRNCYLCLCFTWISNFVNRRPKCHVRVCHYSNVDSSHSRFVCQ